MQRTISPTLIQEIVIAISLSWAFGILAQPTLRLPLWPVPVYLHPLPLFFTVYLLGRTAVYAWGMYILQGAMGMPFFAGGNSGFIYLCGPTGGYIYGMFIAAILLVTIKNKLSPFWSLSIATSTVYIFGLLQLSLFIPTNNLLAVGLYPFLLAALSKIIIITLGLKNLPRLIH